MVCHSQMLQANPGLQICYIIFRIYSALWVVVVTKLNGKSKETTIKSWVGDASYISMRDNEQRSGRLNTGAWGRAHCPSRVNDCGNPAFETYVSNRLVDYICRNHISKLLELWEGRKILFAIRKWHRWRLPFSQELISKQILVLVGWGGPQGGRSSLSVVWWGVESGRKLLPPWEVIEQVVGKTLDDFEGNFMINRIQVSILSQYSDVYFLS